MNILGEKTIIEAANLIADYKESTEEAKKHEDYVEQTEETIEERLGELGISFNANIEDESQTNYESNSGQGSGTESSSQTSSSSTNTQTSQNSPNSWKNVLKKTFNFISGGRNEKE